MFQINPNLDVGYAEGGDLAAATDIPRTGVESIDTPIAEQAAVLLSAPPPPAPAPTAPQVTPSMAPAAQPVKPINGPMTVNAVSGVPTPTAFPEPAAATGAHFTTGPKDEAAAGTPAPAPARELVPAQAGLIDTTPATTVAAHATTTGKWPWWVWLLIALGVYAIVKD